LPVGVLGGEALFKLSGGPGRWEAAAHRPRLSSDIRRSKGSSGLLPPADTSVSGKRRHNTGHDMCIRGDRNKGVAPRHSDKHVVALQPAS
jgi:hypothetical protein